MRTLLRLTGLLAFLFITNCTVHGNFVTEHKDAWFNDPDDGLFYCMANVKDEGTADPACFEANLHEYDDVKKSKKHSKKSENK